MSINVRAGLIIVPKRFLKNPGMKPTTLISGLNKYPKKPEIIISIPMADNSAMSESKLKVWLIDEMIE